MYDFIVVRQIFCGFIVFGGIASPCGLAVETVHRTFRKSSGTIARKFRNFSENFVEQFYELTGWQGTSLREAPENHGRFHAKPCMVLPQTLEGFSKTFGRLPGELPRALPRRCGQRRQKTGAAREIHPHAVPFYT